jgi:hypothetical protein
MPFLLAWLCYQVLGVLFGVDRLSLLLLGARGTWR